MKISQLREIIRETIQNELELESQASDAAKAQGLEYMSFGRWGKDGKVTHTTQSGKLVPIKSMDPVAGRKARTGDSTATAKTPDVQRRRNMTEPERRASDGAYGNTGTSAGNRIVSKVLDKFWSGGADTAGDDVLIGKYGYYKDIPADEFTSTTGIPKKAAVWTAQHNNDYDQPFSYDADTDTFQIHDPHDV